MSLSANAFFDAIARRYDRVYARPRHETRSRVADFAKRVGRTPLDVLDLGVGTGTELPHLLDAGYRVTGVDVSEEMLAMCKQRARPITYVRADFWQALPLPDASFDAVLALYGSFAHPPADTAHPDCAPSYLRLLEEVARVARPGAAFYFEMPSATWCAQNENFVDEASGASITVVAPEEAVWRAWLEPAFAVERVLDDGDELRIFAARRGRAT